MAAAFPSPTPSSKCLTQAKGSARADDSHQRSLCHQVELTMLVWALYRMLRCSVRRFLQTMPFYLD